MARRFSAPYLSEPVSRLATWARNLAVFSAVAVVVSILIVRFGFLEMKPALANAGGVRVREALEARRPILDREAQSLAGKRYADAQADLVGR